MLNTLRYVKTMEEAGISREHAEVHVGIMVELVESNFSTKQDFKDLSAEFRQEMKSVRTELAHELKMIEHRLVLKHAAMTATLLSAAVAFLKLTA